MANEKTKTGSRLDLLETELERFVEVASGELGAEQVIILGSLARALAVSDDALGEWSDLDLVVVARTERPFYERIRDLLDRVKPRVGVDVFVFPTPGTPGVSPGEHMRSERSFIKREVLGKGRIVYERAG